MFSKNKKKTKVSIVVPVYNESTLLLSLLNKLNIVEDEAIETEIIIVDDFSTDDSLSIARAFAAEHDNVIVLEHKKNSGKGAALRTGFERASGEIVAIQDADNEYDPSDLRKLLNPILDDKADVVFGSRFISSEERRILYFWHYLGNKFLTLLSNMFTDLNLSDMETCYKVFRKRVLDKISIEEDRFGFEPEVVAKVAHQRVRVYEMGISYHGRTYSEGKKIGIKDGFRALYCIVRYNAYQAPLFMQFLLYVLIGGTAACCNLAIFLGLYSAEIPVVLSAPIAFVLAACVNYFLCVSLLFRRGAKWNSIIEIVTFVLVVASVCFFDLIVTKELISFGFPAWCAKGAATIIGLFLNFLGRRYLVFPEPKSPDWCPANEK